MAPTTIPAANSANPMGTLNRTSTEPAHHAPRGETMDGVSTPGCSSSDLDLSGVAGLLETIPPVRRRRAPVRLARTIAIVRRDGRLLMHRRARTGLLDGMWQIERMV